MGGHHEIDTVSCQQRSVVSLKKGSCHLCVDLFVLLTFVLMHFHVPVWWGLWGEGVGGCRGWEGRREGKDEQKLMLGRAVGGGRVEKGEQKLRSG